MLNHIVAKTSRSIPSEFFRIRYGGGWRGNGHSDGSGNARSHNGAGRQMHGNSHVFRLTGNQTGGALALVESVMPPESGPPTHVHHREDETVIVLEGALRFQVGERSFVAGPHTSVYVPKGTPHRLSNISRSPARLLTAFTPAGPERSHREVGQPEASGHLLSPPDEAVPGGRPVGSLRFDLDAIAAG